MRRHPAQDILRFGWAALEALEHPKRRLMSCLSPRGGKRDLIDPVNDGGHFAPLEDLGALRRDDVERSLPILCPQEVLDGSPDLSLSQIPGGGLGQEAALGGRILGT